MHYRTPGESCPLAVVQNGRRRPTKAPLRVGQSSGSHPGSSARSASLCSPPGPLGPLLFRARPAPHDALVTANTGLVFRAPAQRPRKKTQNPHRTRRCHRPEFSGPLTRCRPNHRPPEIQNPAPRFPWCLSPARFSSAGTGLALCRPARRPEKNRKKTPDGPLPTILLLCRR